MLLNILIGSYKMLKPDLKDQRNVIISLFDSLFKKTLFNYPRKLVAGYVFQNAYKYSRAGS